MTRQQRTGQRSGNRFSVFDFNEHEEVEDSASVEIIKKFKKRERNNESSLITKYQFLECFARHSQIIDNENKGGSVDGYDRLTCVRHDGIAIPLCPESDVLINVNLGDMEVCPKSFDSSLKRRTENSSCIKDISELVFSSNNERELADMTLEYPGQSDICSTLVTSSISENGPLQEVPTSGPFGHEIDCMNKAVICFPDFVLYGDIYCTEARLTFSCSGIKAEGSSVNGARGTLYVEWSIDDIFIIGSEWCQHETKVSCEVGNQNDFSDIEKFKFSVYDPYWNEAQEAIKLLDVRYKNMWNITVETSDIKYKNSSCPNGASTPRPYFPVLVDSHITSTVGGKCIDVIYPKGDPDAVSINMRDLEFLQPETFINDTIIDFYIQYLKKKIGTDGRRRFHFFNSFFFRKLADLDKDPSSAYEGKEAFERVRKWTRKLDLFGNDYIFIPVNYSLHWSLIIICHPGEVVNLRADETDELHKVPCILHMDSIKGSHRGLKNLFQSYLCEEWKARHIEVVNDLSSKFLELRFVPLELNRNWFPPQEASLKRAKIQNLVYEILQDCSQDVDSDPAVVSSYQCPQFPVTNQPLHGQLTNTSSFQMVPSCDAKQTSDIEITIPRSPVSQENEESQDEPDSLSSRDEEDCYQIGELAAHSPTPSPPDLQLVAAPSPQILISHYEASMDDSSSSDSSSSSANGFQSSSEFGGMVDEQAGEDVSSSTLTEGHTVHVVEDVSPIVAEEQRASKRPKLCFYEGYRMKM